MIVTGARKGNALKRPEGAPRGFWNQLVYTRIVSWGRDFKTVAQYVLKNLWEGFGVPVRRYLARGYKILEISEDGGVFIHASATTEILNALKPG